MVRIAIIQERDYGLDDLVRPLILPEGMDVADEEREMLSKYPPNHCYINIVDYLISKGARLAASSEVEVYER